MFEFFKDRGQSQEEQLDEVLSAYLDGVLPLEDRAALETRLRREPTLVTRLDGLRQTKKALASLPQLEVPRNFILSPSMVAPSASAARAWRRPTWPVFGWATAAAMLLFLLVFAGDVFLITPSLSDPDVHVVAKRTEAHDETDGTSEVAPTFADSGPAPGQIEEAIQPQVEEAAPAVAAEAEVAPAAEPSPETPSDEAEREKVVADESLAPMPQEEVEHVGPAPVEKELSADAAGEARLQVEGFSSDNTATAVAAEAPNLDGTPDLGAVETNEGLVTSAPPVIEVEEVTATDSPTPQLVDEAAPPPAPSLAQGIERASDHLTATPDDFVAIPDVTRQTVDTGPVSQDRPPWLLPVEISLGFLALGLALATLILRQRGV